MYLEHKTMNLLCADFMVLLVEWILAGKTLLDYANLFPQSDYKKNDKIIY